MDYVLAKSSLPVSKTLGSTVRDDVIKKIKDRLNSKAYNDDPTLIKKNRNTLKKMRNNLKKSHRTATHKNLLKGRFEAVNRLVQTFGEASNTLSESENSPPESPVAVAVAAAPAAAAELSPANIATIANLKNSIQALDYSINARAENEKRLSAPYTFEQNASIDEKAQKDVRTMLEQAGFPSVVPSSAPKKVLIKVDSRSDGDCLPSSIYRAAIERPEVVDILVMLELPMGDESSFIEAFRNLLAGNVRSGVLPSQSPGQDIYTQAKAFLLSKNTASYNRLKESFTRESRNALAVIEKNPENREGFLEAYADFLAKRGNWMTHNEMILINQVLGAFNIHVYSFSNITQIPANLSEQVNGVQVLYVYNPDQTHYVYFSMTVPPSEEKGTIEAFQNYMQKTVRQRLLEDNRSERAQYVSQKQKLQAQIQSLERKGRAESPPPSEKGKMPYWKSITSSPQSKKSVEPPAAPAAPVKKMKAKSIFSASPPGSVSSKASKKRYHPLTGEEFKGTTEDWIDLLRKVAESAELDKIASTILF